MTVIRTTYANVNGTPKVVAKADGKQKTVPWDLSKSTDWNHGNAAGVLLTSGKFDGLLISLTHDRLNAMQHDSNDSGTKHGFEV